MSYVKHILLPGEEILYDGHVHPRVLLPGLLWLGFAALILTEAYGTGSGNSWLLGMSRSLAGHFPSTYGLYKMLWRWEQLSPYVALEIKIIALGIALYGFSRLMQQLAIMQTTELVVTNLRIIAKTGIMTVITLEMDRRRVAGVRVNQTFIGRIMGYGDVTIQGFTSSISGLPAIVNPHLLEKFVQ
jgi:hypothetical protein